MIIDFHTHILPPRIKNDRSRYIVKDAAFAQIYSGPKAKIATAEDLIAAMDRDGVDISVVVNYSWTTRELCARSNDYILESSARYPGRLIGFCAVNSFTSDAALKEIERCALAGARGVGELRPDMQKLDYTKKDIMKTFVKLARRHHLVISAHSSEPVGHSYPGKGMATPGVLFNFIGSLDDLPVVCAHWGGGLPFYTLMPEVRTALENVYFDTAASPFLYREEVFPQVLNLVGMDRVLFGSDFPVMPASRLLAQIDSAGIPEESKQAVLSGNARRLLGL